jgi:hypothetical protein
MRVRSYLRDDASIPRNGTGLGTTYPVYPELMVELDAIKRDRTGGLMLCPGLGRARNMAEAGSAGLHARGPHSQRSHPRGWPS